MIKNCTLQINIKVKYKEEKTKEAHGSIHDALGNAIVVFVLLYFFSSIYKYAKYFLVIRKKRLLTCIIMTISMILEIENI